MKRNISAILLTLAIIFLVNTKKAEAAYPNSFAIGAAFTSGYPKTFGGIVTLKIPGSLLVGLDFSTRYYDSSYFNFSGVLDWWFVRMRIGMTPLGFYIGPGVAFDFQFRRDSFLFGMGFRVPIGLSLIFGPFELYIETSPSVHLFDVGVKRPLAFNTYFQLGGQLGFRIWIF